MSKKTSNKSIEKLKVYLNGLQPKTSNNNTRDMCQRPPTGK